MNALARLSAYAVAVLFTLNAFLAEGWLDTLSWAVGALIMATLPSVFWHSGFIAGRSVRGRHWQQSTRDDYDSLSGDGDHH